MDMLDANVRTDAMPQAPQSLGVHRMWRAHDQCYGLRDAAASAG
jgi:hypothetical protein